MHSLPEALAPMAQYKQFIIYTVVPHETKPGKTNKFPCDFRSGRVASAHDSAIWTDPATAIAAAANYNSRGGPCPFGVGFVFTAGDPFWFLDIDGAYGPLDPTNPESPLGWSPLATALVQALPGCAVEVSNSQKGLHIFGTGAVPPHRTKPRDTSLGLEFYNTGRFVALTGLNAVGNAATDCSHLLPALVAQFFAPDSATVGAAPGSIMERWASVVDLGPVPEWRGPTDDDKLLERMLRSQSASAAFSPNKASFSDLFNCNVEALVRAFPDTDGSATPYNASSVDSALAQHLLFWTGKDAGRTLRFMERSALRRDKYDRDDYLPRTILACFDRQSDVLTDKAPEPLSYLPAYAPPPPEGERRAAPRPVAVTGSTFLTIEQQSDLFAGCVYVLDAHRVLVPGGALVQEKQFRVMYGGYSFPMDNANERTSRDAFEAFTQSQATRYPRADSACFKPQEAPGALIHDAGRVRVNTWWPVDVPRAVGDPAPFLLHMEKLLPDPRDRFILMCYMAACVQHVGYKFQWAPVVQGVEGNGKTLLSRCVAEAVGRRYVHWPKASKLANQFNGWMVGKVFYAVEDIYVPDGRSDVMEDLKPMITGGDGLEIEGKGADQISADICGNFMFNSNRKDSVIKHRNDRRYGIFFTAQQEAAHLARDGMTGDYMPNLYNWLNNGGGFAIVSELLHTFPIPDEWNPAKLLQRAPDTTSTEAAISASRGGIEQEVVEAIEQGLPGFAGDWVSSLALDRLLERLNRSRQLTHAKRNDLLVALGYMLHPGLVGGRVNNTVLPDAGKPRLFVKVGSVSATIQGPSAIAAAYSAAQEINVKQEA